MENSTNFTEIFFNFKPKLWIIDFVTINIFTLISFYLLVALLYHKNKIEKPREKKFIELLLHEKYAVLSKYICILVATASFTGNVIGVGWNVAQGIASFSNLTWPQGTANVVCAIAPKLAVIGYCYTIFLVLLFLWLRQSIFYVHPDLGMTNFKSVKRFGFATLIVYFVCCLSFFIAFLITVGFLPTTIAGTCILDERSPIQFTGLIAFWGLISLLMQIILLGLFIYPVCQRTWWRNQEYNSFLKTKVIKATVLVLICFASDGIFVLLICILFEENATNSDFPAVINLVINASMTIVCFDCWKAMIWPWSKNITSSTVDEPYCAAIMKQYTVDNHTSIKDIRSNA